MNRVLEIFQKTHWDSRQHKNRSFFQKIKAIANRIEYLLQISKERRQLSKLTDEQLRDIGLHRADVQHETNRDFFDVPENLPDQKTRR